MGSWEKSWGGEEEVGKGKRKLGREMELGRKTESWGGKRKLGRETNLGRERGS